MAEINPDWTAYVAGQMHKYRIKTTELAARCVYGVDENGQPKSYHHTYVSTVLNGNKKFDTEEGAEGAKNRILSALAELIAERQEKTDAAEGED